MSMQIRVIGWYKDILAEIDIPTKTELARELNAWVDHEGVARVEIIKSDSSDLPNE